MFQLRSLGSGVKRYDRTAGDLKAGDVAYQWEASGNSLGGPSARYSKSSDACKHRWLNGNQSRPRSGLSGGAGVEREAFAAHAVLGRDVCLNGHCV